MSALCAYCCGRVADYFLIYLQAAERIERLRQAQYSCGDEFQCVCARSRPLRVIISRDLHVQILWFCIRGHVSVHARMLNWSPVCVWDVQLSVRATGGKCCSVSRFAPSLPPHMVTLEISQRQYLLLCIILFLLLFSAWLSNPALLLASPFFGIQVSERGLKRAALKHIRWRVRFMFYPFLLPSIQVFCSWVNVSIKKDWSMRQRSGAEVKQKWKKVI